MSLQNVSAIELERVARERLPVHGGAEIVTGARACWYGLLVVPQRETVVCDQVARRGFGAYLPMFARKSAAGAMLQRPLFPGYLFVLVWGLHVQRARLESCPGVQGVWCQTGRPVKLHDRDIAIMRRIELELWLAACHPYRHRRPRNGFRASERCHGDLASLDERARIGALHRSLGLAS